MAKGVLSSATRRAVSRKGVDTGTRDACRFAVVFRGVSSLPRVSEAERSTRVWRVRGWAERIRRYVIAHNTRRFGISPVSQNPVLFLTLGWIVGRCALMGWPTLNNTDLMAEHMTAIKNGKSISKPIYNHVSGNLDAPEDIAATPIFVRPATLSLRVVKRHAAKKNVR